MLAFTGQTDAQCTGILTGFDGDDTARKVFLRGAHPGGVAETFKSGNKSLIEDFEKLKDLHAGSARQSEAPVVSWAMKRRQVSNPSTPGMRTSRRWEEIGSVADVPGAGAIPGPPVPNSTRVLRDGVKA